MREAIRQRFLAILTLGIKSFNWKRLTKAKRPRAACGIIEAPLEPKPQGDRPWGTWLSSPQSFLFRTVSSTWWALPRTWSCAQTKSPQPAPTGWGRFYWLQFQGAYNGSNGHTTSECAPHSALVAGELSRAFFNWQSDYDCSPLVMPQFSPGLRAIFLTSWKGELAFFTLECNHRGNSTLSWLIPYQLAPSLSRSASAGGALLIKYHSFPVYNRIVGTWSLSSRHYIHAHNQKPSADPPPHYGWGLCFAYCSTYFKCT